MIFVHYSQIYANHEYNSSIIEQIPFLVNLKNILAQVMRDIFHYYKDNFNINLFIIINYELDNIVNLLTGKIKAFFCNVLIKSLPFVSYYLNILTLYPFITWNQFVGLIFKILTGDCMYLFVQNLARIANFSPAINNIVNEIRRWIFCGGTYESFWNFMFTHTYMKDFSIEMKKNIIEKYSYCKNISPNIPKYDNFLPENINENNKVALCFVKDLCESNVGSLRNSITNKAIKPTTLSNLLNRYKTIKPDLTLSSIATSLSNNSKYIQSYNPEIDYNIPENFIQFIALSEQVDTSPDRYVIPAAILKFSLGCQHLNKNPDILSVIKICFDLFTFPSEVTNKNESLISNYPQLLDNIKSREIELGFLYFLFSEKNKVKNPMRLGTLKSKFPNFIYNIIESISLIIIGYYLYVYDKPSVDKRMNFIYSTPDERNKQAEIIMTKLIKTPNISKNMFEFFGVTDTTETKSIGLVFIALNLISKMFLPPEIIMSELDSFDIPKIAEKFGNIPSNFADNMKIYLMFFGDLFTDIIKFIKNFILYFDKRKNSFLMFTEIVQFLFYLSPIMNNIFKYSAPLHTRVVQNKESLVKFIDLYGCDITKLSSEEKDTVNSIIDLYYIKTHKIQISSTTIFSSEGININHKWLRQNPTAAILANSQENNIQKEQLKKVMNEITENNEQNIITKAENPKSLYYNNLEEILYKEKSKYSVSNITELTNKYKYDSISKTEADSEKQSTIIAAVNQFYGIQTGDSIDHLLSQHYKDDKKTNLNEDQIYLKIFSDIITLNEENETIFIHFNEMKRELNCNTFEDCKEVLKQKRKENEDSEYIIGTLSLFNEYGAPIIFYDEDEKNINQLKQILPDYQLDMKSNAQETYQSVFHAINKYIIVYQPENDFLKNKVNLSENYQINPQEVEKEAKRLNISYTSKDTYETIHTRYKESLLNKVDQIKRTPIIKVEPDYQPESTISLQEIRNFILILLSLIGISFGINKAINPPRKANIY